MFIRRQRAFISTRATALKQLFIRFDNCKDKKTHIALLKGHLAHWSKFSHQAGESERFEDDYWTDGEQLITNQIKIDKVYGSDGYWKRTA